MNRSDEIIKLFQCVKIPSDITKKILSIENKDSLHNSYIEWEYIQLQNKSYKKLLFSEEFYRTLLLSDIVHINGDFNTLNYHVICFRKLKKQAENDANFIMSFRF
jgi:hypothetical protein